jgi:hypothetical protein
VYKLKLQKAVLYMYEYTEGELYNWSLTFEVILCTDYICWFTCLLIPYINQQNALNKYNRTDHKTHSILGTNCCVCWLEGAILREFIKNKRSYVQHMLQAPVTISCIIEWKYCCNNNTYSIESFLLYILSCLYSLDCVYKVWQ